MIVGVPKEIKADEYRVGLAPVGVRELVGAGHDVVVETGAGSGSGFADEAYRAQGATIVAAAADVFERADLVVKVKEPLADEVALLRAGQTLFTYLHLAPNPELTRGLVDSGANAVAYETVSDARGRLPLLAPMSEVAGRLAAQAGAFALQRPSGGRGLLLGGVPGVPPANVMIIGGGVVGANAAAVAEGMGARVTVFDRSLDRLRELDAVFGGRIGTAYSAALAIEAELARADLVIGAVLVHGARAPRVVTREHLRMLKPRAVLVDVAIDQGGCFETSRPTTHAAPVYELDGVTHYCVANMPGAVPVTSTAALTNATLPYIMRIAELGPMRALERDRGLLEGLAVAAGALTSRPVAEAQGLEWRAPREAVGTLR